MLAPKFKLKDKVYVHVYCKYTGNLEKTVQAEIQNAKLSPGGIEEDFRLINYFEWAYHLGGDLGWFKEEEIFSI